MFTGVGAATLNENEKLASALDTGIPGCWVDPSRREVPDTAPVDVTWSKAPWMSCAVAVTDESAFAEPSSPLNGPEVSFRLSWAKVSSVLASLLESEALSATK